MPSWVGHVMNEMNIVTLYLTWELDVGSRCSSTFESLSLSRLYWRNGEHNRFSFPSRIMHVDSLCTHLNPDFEV